MARLGAAEEIAKFREGALAEIGLYELRRARDVSQTELAARLEITQAAISKFENAEDVRLSTLRQYIEALGGRLELSARFEDCIVPIDLAGRRDAP